MEKKTTFFTRRVVIGGCVFALAVMMTVIQAKYNPFLFSAINFKILATATEQPQLATSSVPIPNQPVIVTGFSSNHFAEAQALFFVVHTYLPDYRIVAYDLGLTEAERARTRKHCKCDLRSLDYDRYPAHVRVPTTYAFKPLIINETVREFGFVFWMDASVRLITNNVEPLWNFTRSVGFACAQDTHIVYCLTNPATFAALNVSQPAMYERARTIQATYLLFTSRPDIVENILEPWVQCALNKQCIAPEGAAVAGCQFEKSPSYCNCHRFDQSALEVILYRFFSGQFTWDPKAGQGQLAPFSIGTWLNLLPQYHVLEVNRGDQKDYFPA